MAERRRRKDNCFSKKRKRKVIVAITLLVLISIISYGAYVFITVTWIVTIPTPSVNLISPTDNTELAVNTTEFNWTGSGGSGTLTYVWYADTDPTFTSPNVRSIFMDTTTNVTPSPFVDGDWYWRVEVTDGENINVSETWHFKVQTVPDNYFPYLENASLSPTDGTTGTTFHYNITFYDLDNDTAEYVNVSIDGSQYMMSEVDASDINTTNGKNYTYTTTLPVGVHNYSFVCSDGNATNSTILYVGPTVIQAQAPVISNHSPANESVDIDLNPGFSITVSDANGDLMNITWYDNSSGAWTVFATNTNVNNGTYNQDNTNITDYNTVYWWKVVVADESNSTTAIYHFRTITAISIYDIYPSNSDIDICPCALLQAESGIYMLRTPLFFGVRNDNGSLMNVTVFMKDISGSYESVYRENNTGNGTVWFYLDVATNETYYWYVNITDTTNNDTFTSDVYNFTTIDDILDCNVTLGKGSSYAWVVGVALALMCVPLVFVLRKKEER